MPEHFSEVLGKFQAKHYRELADVLKDVDVDDIDTFAAAIIHVFGFTDLTPESMAYDLGLIVVAPETCRRWHSVLREACIPWLIKALHQRADMIEAFPDELGKPKFDYIPNRLRLYRTQPRT